MVNSHHSQKNRNKIINSQQSGAAPTKTLPEQIAFYDEEIRKAKSWIEYYTNPKNPRNQNAKMAATYAATVSRLEMEREIRLAQLYASNIPFHGGKMEMAKVTK
jgi:hypothetical protein